MPCPSLVKQSLIFHRCTVTNCRFAKKSVQTITGLKTINLGQLGPQTECGQLQGATGGSDNAHMVFPCLPFPVAVAY